MPIEVPNLDTDPEITSDIEQKVDEEALRRKVEEAAEKWLDDNVREAEPMTEQTLVRLVEYLAKSQRETFEQLISGFENSERYANRPNIRFEGIRREGAPLVSILGWREGEASSIHDHGKCLAAYHIFKESIKEERFTLSGRSEDHALSAETSVRELQQGQTSSGAEGYIHRVSHNGHSMGISIHAYWPPVKDFCRYQFGEDGGIYIESVHR